MTMDPEQLARKFHSTYEALAPSFGYETREDSRRPWEEVPEGNRRLMIAVCRVISAELEREDGATAIRAYLDRSAQFSDQDLAYDRNTWQQRLGVLLILVEGFCKDALSGRRPTVAEADAQWLLDKLYHVVNCDPHSGNVSDPYADIAALSTRVTLETALAGGLVAPGPHAPAWMLPDEDEDTPTE